MNNLEQLESHHRMYSWLKEQLKTHRWLSKDDRTDWTILEGDYPELLMFVENLISHIKILVNREQELLADITSLELRSYLGYLDWDEEDEEIDDDDDIDEQSEANCWVEYPTVEE